MGRLFVLILSISVRLAAQDAPASDVAPRHARPRYFEVGAGFDFSGFKDLATSPLLYKGGGGQFVSGIVGKDSGVESNISLRISSLVYNTTANLKEQKQSVVSTAFLSYSLLYRVLSLRSDKWNLKAGGKIDITGNIRENTSLLNSGTGIESFQTLFGVLKLTTDLSRTQLKRKKILFFRYKLKPKRRDLSFQFNGSILNTTYRNGYAYLNQAAITGSNNAFENYKFSTFSGLRLSSALELTRYLKNGNGIKYAYLWDAYKTGGDLPKFAMTHHIYQIALLFRVK